MKTFILNKINHAVGSYKAFSSLQKKNYPFWRCLDGWNKSKENWQVVTQTSCSSLKFNNTRNVQSKNCYKFKSAFFILNSLIFSSVGEFLWISDLIEPYRVWVELYRLTRCFGDYLAIFFVFYFPEKSWKLRQQFLYYNFQKN